MKIPISIQFILLYFILFPLYAYGDNTVKIDANTSSIESFNLDYGEKVNILSDINDQPIWKTIANRVHFIPKKNYWYKLSLQNDTPYVQARILLLSETNIEYVDLYSKKDTGFIKEASGATIGIDARPVNSHFIAFKVTLQPYETSTRYLHIQSLLPSFAEIWLLTDQDFDKYEKQALLIYVVYFGILLTTLIYSLIITVVLKEKILLVNTLYLFFSLLWIMLNSGIYLYFFPSYVAWRLSCSISITYILLIEFAKFFINTKEISLTLHRIVLFLESLLLFTAILSFIDMTLGISLLVYTGFVVLIFLITAIVLFLFVPIKRIIKIYLMIVLPLLTALFIYLLASANIIHANYMFQYSYVVGSFIELNGFALLTLYYLLKMKKEKEYEKNELDILRERYTQELEKEIIKKTEELYASNQVLEKNFQYQIALMQEIHHRVKNNLQMIISIISLELLKSKSEETNSILKNTIIRIQSISTIHEMLYRSSDITSISLSDYTHNLIRSVRSIFDETNMKIYISCNEHTVGMRDAINLGLIIIELVSNSIKHNKNSENLKISVRITYVGSKLSLFVKDNGIGFDIDATDLSKSVGINLIESIASSFNDSYYSFCQRKGTLFALTCRF
ncbi:histidine kinase dimerization/phosphoacceptor domain -containing protein [Sulfuricurvum sp.]|uniref:histidine kinase dimerization/phosphoacceptor domain -containing protein n=1 Tax=Sulfuricurvum sp. TaxID=2025608 RepID=UPI00260A2412|nr:histidine kinase dimerization/phosphoacceptor domain -containing protein [Sulfuricurvum sp.]MDD2266138.1 histidine kinase dimerization/phosphoacceptor domain -containing protein [Sulfuricurvum sp.]MDD2783167.1 histidine kinase dimerization/phosphoacceptor domain -containing protein [Sulfuricurvum sp.]